MAKEERRKKFSWHAMTSSGGTLELSLYFPDTRGMTKQLKEKALAAALADSYKFMMSKGYLPPEARFMSSSDLAKEYGKTRQYWEKLLNEGKIPYKETSAGRITTDLWVQGYVNNKEEVDKYIRNCNLILKAVSETKKRSGTVTCSECKESRFEFNVNVNGNTNGICRNCGFHINILQ